MPDLRRLLRYRQLVVQESVRMQNKIAGLLMETGHPFFCSGMEVVASK
jgi:hypothetical protein